MDATVSLVRDLDDEVVRALMAGTFGYRRVVTADLPTSVRCIVVVLADGHLTCTDAEDSSR